MTKQEGNKPNYKAIIDKAIGEKPSLVKASSHWITDHQSGLKLFAETRAIFDYPATTGSYEYKQQTYQEFLNDKQDTK